MTYPLSDIDVDRELNLKELLSGLNKQRLQRMLEKILETPVFILDLRGECLLGVAGETTLPSTPILGELETIGNLYANASPEQLKTAGEILQLQLYANSRYLMAAELHIQTQYADYEELQRKNAELEQSELRYKTLAEDLERRVKKQVKTIQATQLKLYESEKIASVGRLAAGMAHEINNPLGFIRSNLSSGLSYLGSLADFDRLIKSPETTRETLLQAWLSGGLLNLLEDLRDIFHESIEGAERIASIIKDLKRFSKIDQPTLEPADINEIIHQTCQITLSELGKEIKLIESLASDLPIVYCHAASLREVFHHLLVNAADAVGHNGKILFKTSIDNNKLLIEVRDNGCGIAQSELPHVFEAFYTSKEIGKRMGLGLSVCHHVISAHRGAIHIKSKPGLGTLVQIHLPLSQNTAEK